jgi:hypothetical protein
MYKFASNEGFRAGLATWAYFVLIFYLLSGLRAELCVVLGAVAGLAVWNIVGYLKAEKLPDEPAQPDSEAAQPGVIRRVGSRLFDRFRGSPAADQSNEPDVLPPPGQAPTGRWRTVGLRRPPKRYIGRRPPRRIGR